MTNSEKLRALADWFDLFDKKNPNTQITGREVQIDLRVMATEFEQLNKPVVMQAEGSDGVAGAAVGQRSVDTATCGVDDNGWNCKRTTEPGGVASQCMNGCVLAGSSCEG